MKCFSKFSSAIALFSVLTAAHPLIQNSEWDFHISGRSLFKRDGTNQTLDNMPNYSMRGRVVDPSSTGVDPGVKQYSGYLDDDKNDKHLFFWFFESRSKPKDDPVILWLNGGPGCSSMLGLFTSLGPSLLDRNTGGFTRNQWSWNNNASVLFIDQPVNAGYSYSKTNPTNTTLAAGKDIYALLTLFFQKFPQYNKQDFHIAGESYAGHYIPAMAKEILSRKPQERNINLKSIMIGNGIIDPLTQYKYYQPMACGEGGYPAVLEPSVCQTMKNASEACVSEISDCQKTKNATQCVETMHICNESQLKAYSKTGHNVYDVTQKCGTPGVVCNPVDLGIQKYLNKPSFLKAIGVQDKTWDVCNSDVYQLFAKSGDWMQSFVEDIPGILEQIPVLIYAGDADYICNWLGNKAWTEALPWKGKNDYNKAPMEPFKTKSGEEVGQTKNSSGLTFTRIYKSGHAVPADQPEAAFAMLTSWLASVKSFRNATDYPSFKFGISEQHQYYG
ncbi:hypothetical protein AA313_de0203470 [Arthrobotrys entomopaga]|nr:hypothetical protein AA313_de0203470 [Arthrobotrys entomopaga]